MADTQANLEPTSSGRVRPVCEFCGRRGRAIAPDSRGRVDIFDLARGWTVAPYPLEHVHADGSTGDLFTCPACNARLTRGEALRTRQGGTSRRIDSDEHEGALRAAERTKSALRERGAID